MRWIDVLDEIFSSFRKQKLRTGLTALGIAIGAFAITLMIGLGQGLQTYIESQFLAFHNDRVLLAFPRFAKVGSRFLDRITKLGRPAEKLDERDEKQRRSSRGGMWIEPDQLAKLRVIPGVEAVSPMTWFQVDGVALVQADTAHAGWYATDFAALCTAPVVGTPVAGRLPVPEDTAELVLSPQYAQSFGLAPAELLGREVELRVPDLSSVLRRFNFRDPSVFKDRHRIYRATVVGLAEVSPLSRTVYPSMALGRSMGRYQSGNASFLSDEKFGAQAQLRLVPGAQPESVKAAVREIGLSARTVSDQLDEVNKVFLVVDVVLTSFGFLALLVATLGIANTLLMAITERTREIGIMKALGSTASSIRWLFSLEAAAIGLVGGVCGTLAAVACGIAGDFVAKRAVEAAAALEGYSVFFFPWWLLLGAPAFCCLIGGLAGIYPANRAAALDPIRALRHD